MLPLSMGSGQELVLSPAAEQRPCASTGKVTFLCVCCLFVYLHYFLSHSLLQMKCFGRSESAEAEVATSAGEESRCSTAVCILLCCSAAAQGFAPDGVVLLGCIGEGRAAWAEQGWGFTVVEALKVTDRLVLEPSTS